MNTRDLFEQLVADEPPLVISPSAASARGRRARTRRTAAVTAAVAATVVLVTAGVTQLAQQSHTHNPATKPTPRPTSVSTRALGSTMPFSSTSQITASAARANAVIRQDAVGRGTLIEGKPPSLGVGATGQQGALVTLQTQYAIGTNSGVLTALVSAPSEYASRYAPSFASAQGPCTARGGPQLVRCVRTPLAKGAVLWTYDEEIDPAELAAGAVASPASPALVAISRYAILVDGDRSVLALTYSLQQTHVPGGSLEYMSLDSSAAVTTAQLGQLAQAAAKAWQGPAPDVPAAVGAPTIASAQPVETHPAPFASAFAAQPPPEASTSVQAPAVACHSGNGSSVEFDVTAAGELTPPCIKAKAGQRLEVVNKSKTAVTIRVAAASLFVKPGATASYDQVLTIVFRRGVYDVTIDGSRAHAQLWVDPTAV